MPAAPAIVATALPADAPARLHIPLKARLAPFGPVLLVFLVAAFFGALLGTPGPGRQQVAESVRSPDAPALKRLDDIRFRLRDDLASASTADEQANLAARLAVAYGRAADNLSSPALVSAAQDASAAYVSLEDAVQAGDEDAYEGARARVQAAEAKIASELSPSSARARRG